MADSMIAGWNRGTRAYQNQRERDRNYALRERQQDQSEAREQTRQRELAGQIARDKENRDWVRNWKKDDRNYSRTWDEESRTYGRTWKEDDRTYSRGRDTRKDEIDDANRMRRQALEDENREVALEDRERSQRIADENRARKQTLENRRLEREAIDRETRLKREKEDREWEDYKRANIKEKIDDKKSYSKSLKDFSGTLKGKTMEEQLRSLVNFKLENPDPEMQPYIKSLEQIIRTSNPDDIRKGAIMSYASGMGDVSYYLFQSNVGINKQIEQATKQWNAIHKNKKDQIRTIEPLGGGEFLITENDNDQTKLTREDMFKNMYFSDVGRKAWEMELNIRRQKANATKNKPGSAIPTQGNITVPQAQKQVRENVPEMVASYVKPGEKKALGKDAKTITTNVTRAINKLLETNLFSAGVDQDALDDAIQKSLVYIIEPEERYKELPKDQKDKINQFNFQNSVLGGMGKKDFDYTDPASLENLGRPLTTWLANNEKFKFVPEKAGGFPMGNYTLSEIVKQTILHPNKFTEDQVTTYQKNMLLMGGGGEGEGTLGELMKRNARKAIKLEESRRGKISDIYDKDMLLRMYNEETSITRKETIMRRLKKLSNRRKTLDPFVSTVQPL